MGPPVCLDYLSLKAISKQKWAKWQNVTSENAATLETLLVKRMQIYTLHRQLFYYYKHNPAPLLNRLPNLILTHTFWRWLFCSFCSQNLNLNSLQPWGTVNTNFVSWIWISVAQFSSSPRVFIISLRPVDFIQPLFTEYLFPLISVSTLLIFFPVQKLMQNRGSLHLSLALEALVFKEGFIVDNAEHLKRRELVLLNLGLYVYIYYYYCYYYYHLLGKKIWNRPSRSPQLAACCHKIFWATPIVRNTSIKSACFYSIRAFSFFIINKI